MIRNYLLTALRHIRKSKVNFVFKLGGLSLALFCFMAIAIFVSYQLSFDRFNEDFNNIYRVITQRKDNGVAEKYAIAPLAMGPLVAELPGVSHAARLSFGSHTTLRSHDRVFDCEGLAETDSSVFDVFTFEFIKGNKKALNDPNAIVLTRSLALRMFGTTDVLQELISLNGSSDILQVTAVIEDTRSNSHLYAEAFMRIRGEWLLTERSIADPVGFSDESAALYVRLHEPEPEALTAQLTSLVNTHVSRSIQEEFGFQVMLQPLTDIYLSRDYRYDYALHGNVTYVYTFSTLGILLLLVASINYVNLSIADYSTRAAETGVRRVFGARRSQLMWQASIEVGCFGITSVLLSIAVLYGVFPYVAPLLDPNLNFSMLFNTTTVGIVAAGLFVLLLLSCWLPARQLSVIRISNGLKAIAGYNSPLSRALLFTQFAVSVLCLFCTLVVGNQLAFVHNKGLGFDRKNLLVLSMPSEFTVRDLQTFKTELERIPGVTNVSNSSFRIGNGYWKDWYFVEDGDKIKEVELYEVFSDDDLFTTLDIPVLAGRTFDSSIPADSGAAFVINETAARELGWENPVGKRIYTHPEDKGKWDGTIVGVVADINISPLYYKVRPLVMRLPWQNEYPDAFIYVRYAGDLSVISREIEEQYKVVMPGYPLMLRGVDELYNGTHRKEQKAFDSLKLGTIVIVFVSLLGIFSMAAYLSARRMKEFGIRKVLGASRREIAQLNLKFFLRAALVANLTAQPVAYWLMGEWLTTFAYRAPITFIPFVLVGVISVSLVLLSGGYSALRSGAMNPVDVLKAQ